MSAEIDRLAVDTVRCLAMDAVQKANSGHPGTPMALAPVAHVVWDEFLRFAPDDPRHPGRDRFVLSCGHASMLLYGTLHLWGQGVSLDDIKTFRQWGSPCAGHPEYGHCPAVETTTGPLGQGFANAVGMALAREWLAARYNTSEVQIIDWQVIALGGDGDLMEGLSYEAAALAGHLGLGALTWIWDDNRITIEGATDLAWGEDVPARFRALGWETQSVDDANDLVALREVLRTAKQERDKPLLIRVRSHIGYGAPHKQDTAGAHGAPLGEDEIRAAKTFFGFDPDQDFQVPEGVREEMTARGRAKGEALRSDWDARWTAFAAKEPEKARELKTLLAGDLPEGWEEGLPRFESSEKGQAGRGASGKVLQSLGAAIPWLVGGSADLAGSNKTEIAGGGDFEKDRYDGRNLHFGIREHAMGAIANGMALSGLRPYTGTFLVFSDYMRPVHRLAAMMKLPVTWIYTHDSIGVGEDGPTHQPIEHVASLRAIPGLDVYRPGDANEVVEAWRSILATKDRPSAIVLSRQAHSILDRTRFAAVEGVRRGGYVVADGAGDLPEVILLATGSELALAVQAWERLTADGVSARVVSLPCWELFERQDETYRESVLPNAVVARVAVEAGSSFGWQRYVGRRGATVTRDDFGASAPGAELFRRFGFTVEAVVAAARAQMEAGGA